MGNPKLLIAGDTIIDWVIHNGKVQACAGGAGNIVRGLQVYGHNVVYLTVFNPILYPLQHAFELDPRSISDLSYINVSVRNYDVPLLQRFRENVVSKVFDIKGAFAVIAHEDSCIRRFDSVYADVRDPYIKGTCQILRMSSSDPWEEIMANIQFKVAIITYKNKVDIYYRLPDEWETITFAEIAAVDDVGAGDTFNVGFLDWFIYASSKGIHIREGIIRGIELAQEKVTKVGVFL